MADPILIWGAGAVGGTIGAYWTRAGNDVLLVDKDPDHVAAMNATGLAIEGPVEEFRQSVRAVLPADVKGRYRRVVLAVKAHHTEDAARQLLPHVADDGYVLSAQNGLNELVIAKVVGEERTMGCFVNFGADYLGPGRVIRGNRAAVVVGELDGRITDRVREMHALLRQFEPDAVLTDDIFAYLWGKLGYGALLFGTALTNESIADALASPRHLPVYKALGNEVMGVAGSQGREADGLQRLRPGRLRARRRPGRAAGLHRRHGHLQPRFGQTHSGIWRDLAVRKRRTEIDAQIGIIATIGKEVGVPTPALQKLVFLIHEIEEGRRPLAWETLDEMLQA